MAQGTLNIVRLNRVRRVLAVAAELAKVTKTLNWRFDHGHLVGDTPRFKNNGDPVIDPVSGRQALREHDIACVVSEGHHVVRGLPDYDRARIDLRYMASIEPKKLLQLLEDFEAIVADYEARLKELAP